MNQQTKTNLTERRRRTPSGSAGGRRHTERGASLIEIMVVLVILLTGIFIVIRIFPVGFGTLAANESRTLATRLAQLQLGQLKADSANLPSGVQVAYVDPNKPNELTIRTEIDPDDMSQLITYPIPSPLPSPYPVLNPYFTDVNKYRYIQGEAVKIPLPTASSVAGAATGSVYTLKFGPAYIDASVINPTTASADQAKADTFLKVRGGSLTGINIESDNPTTTPSPANRGEERFLRSIQTYLIDYGDDNDDAEILFYPRAPRGSRPIPYRIFDITISYFNESNNAEETVTTSVRVDDSNQAAWQKIPTVTNGTTYIKNAQIRSETVSRQFIRLTRGTNWDPNDPYEYKLYSDNITGNGGASTTPANIGVLNFNPAGANYNEQTSYGTRSFFAYIDYAVLDWHIIREDREVPLGIGDANGNIPINTTLKFIKRTGDAERDNTVYNGLYNDPLGGDDIQVFNLDDPTGTPLVQGAPGAADYYIDNDPRGGTYRTGTIYVNKNRFASGTKLRILYKAEGDWAVSLQKAYAEYKAEAVLDKLTGNIFYKPRPAGFGTFGQDGAGSTAKLWFSRTEYNKSVTLSLQYTLPSGEIKRLAPVQVTINDGVELNQPNPLNGPNPPLNYTYAEVRKYVPASLQSEFDSAGGNWSVVGTAKGVSLKTRVIWHDQNSNNNTWRIQDMDTYLTQSAY